MAGAWHVLSPAMGTRVGPRLASSAAGGGPHRRVAPALPAAALTARKSDCRRSSVSIALAACAHIAPFHPRHQSTRGARAAHVCRSTPATAASVRSSPGSEPRRIQAVRSNRHTTPTSSVDNVSKPPGSSSSVKSKGNGMCVEVVTKTRPQRFRSGVLNIHPFTRSPRSTRVFGTGRRSTPNAYATMIEKQKNSPNEIAATAGMFRSSATTLRTPSHAADSINENPIPIPKLLAASSHDIPVFVYVIFM